MTNNPNPDLASRPEVVLHQERLQVDTVRQPTERLLVRRVITTETRQIEVTVRREELRLERLSVEDQPTSTTAASTGGTSTGRPALVLVLSQEVPTVQLHTQPYERVTLHVDTVTDQQHVTEPLAHEQVEVVTTPPAR